MNATVEPQAEEAVPPKQPHPHGYIQCPVSYLPPEEWNAMMARLDALLPLVEELPETVEHAARRVLTDGNSLQQDLAYRMTQWEEANRHATVQLLGQVERLEQRQKEIDMHLKLLTNKLYPMAGIAAGFGAVMMSLLWMILS